MELMNKALFINNLLRKFLKKKPQIGDTVAANSGRFSITIENTHNMGARENQQDSFSISDISNKALRDKKGIFAVVADGMGGLTDGDKISTMVTTSMLKHFNEKPFQFSLEIELLNMLITANNEVNHLLNRVRVVKSGTTVVSVIISQNKLYWISVGDSRICLIRKGALIQLNREHIYGPELDEKAVLGEISFEEAQNNPQRAALTSYLGMGRLAKIDRNINPLQLVSGDRVILMSDGIFKTLSDEEILLAMQAPPNENMDSIEQTILLKNKPLQDNFTAIILSCQ